MNTNELNNNSPDTGEKSKKFCGKCEHFFFEHFHRIFGYR